MSHRKLAARMLAARNLDLRSPFMLSLVGASVVALAACNRDRGTARTDSKESMAKAGAISMCTLMPKEQVNSIIGTAYTKADASDERSSSSCHYSTETDPTGLSLDLTWIQPSDYSSPAQHLALQQAGLGGAKLGGKLETGMVPGAGSASGPLHVPSGPVDGVGDEATQNMLLLTARKGDYTLMVQIIPDVMALMKDSTAGPKVVEQEKNIARAVLSKV